jgi:hypothetical protein
MKIHWINSINTKLLIQQIFFSSCQ